MALLRQGRRRQVAFPGIFEVFEAIASQTLAIFISQPFTVNAEWLQQSGEALAEAASPTFPWPIILGDERAQEIAGRKVFRIVVDLEAGTDREQKYGLARIPIDI